jgi:DNA-directed RNA polymerase specialized sigma subunit
MYRNYNNLKIKYVTLEPQFVQVLSFTPPSHNQESKVEKMATERADIHSQIKFIQLCLGAMTHDERLFIEYRYNQELTIELVADLMKWSRSEVYRLRKSVLAKTRWLINVTETQNKRNAS